LICGGMIIALDSHTLTAAFSWMAIGLVVYFSYGRAKSKLNVPSGTPVAGKAK
jgi:APA family basic amino acid/polyamine antiporter